MVQGNKQERRTNAGWATMKIIQLRKATRESAVGKGWRISVAGSREDAIGRAVPIRQSSRLMSGVSPLNAKIFTVPSWPIK